MGGPHGALTTDIVRRAPWVGVEPPAIQVVTASAAVLVAAAAVEIAIGDTVGAIVGVVLVLVAATTALIVAPRDLFTAGVLPPLLLLALLLVVAVVHPDGIAATRLEPSASVAQRVIAGFVDLAGAVVVAHGAALVLVALRVRVVRLRGGQPAAGRTEPC